MTTLTTTERITAIKHLASGKNIGVVAQILGHDAETIRQVAQQHGHPDPAKLAWAADMLAGKADEDAVRDLPAGMDEDRLRVLSAAARVDPPRTAAAPAKLATGRGLVADGKAHRSKRIRAAAVRAGDALDRLASLLADDEARHAAKARADAEKAQARAKVDRLTEQLAQAKAELRGKPAANPMGATDQPAKRTVTRKVTKGEHPCEVCERIFDTAQGRALHQRRAHGDLQGRTAS